MARTSPANLPHPLATANSPAGAEQHSASGKTIVIAVPYAVNVRDVLRTAVLSPLREAGARIVILSPAHAEPEFVREFSGERMVLEPLHRFQPGRLERR